MHEMSQARRVLDTLGPGRLLLVGPAPQGLGAELSKLGCRVATTAANGLPAALAEQPVDAVIWSWDGTSPWPSAAALAGRDGAAPALVVVRDAARAAPPAPELVTLAVAHGWRRSVSPWTMAHYGDLDRPDGWTELFFEPVPAGAGVSRLPMGRTDPTLSAHPIADAQLGRYAKAAEWVRPGDHVVVVGDGSGAGAALLARRSRCAHVRSFDESAAGVQYAQRHFGLRDLLRIELGSPDRLPGVDSRSVDMIVALDGWDRAASVDAAMAELARILKPDGRLIVGVAANASAAVASCLARQFLIESRCHQPLPAALGPRVLSSVPAGQPMPTDGWQLIVASANPVAAGDVPFRHPEFGETPADVAVTDFGRRYDNPWIYRPMVQMGQRLQDEQLLTDLALDVLAQARPESADFGAALCVLAYQVLGRRQMEQMANLRPLVDAYAASPTDNPHVARWQISLEFAAALGCLAAGERSQAHDYFDRVTRRDPLAFSPLLSTKTVAASFWLGILDLVDREPQSARRRFEAGCQAAARALQAPIERSVGSLATPNTFGFQELAEVADMASQCAQALDALGHFDSAPGRFWRQVDTRRFGLATWLLHLERENRELREQLQALAR